MLLPMGDFLKKNEGRFQAARRRFAAVRPDRREVIRERVPPDRLPRPMASRSAADPAWMLVSARTVTGQNKPSITQARSMARRPESLPTAGRTKRRVLGTSRRIRDRSQQRGGDHVRPLGRRDRPIYSSPMRPVMRGSCRASRCRRAAASCEISEDLARLLARRRHPAWKSMSVHARADQRSGRLR